MTTNQETKPVTAEGQPAARGRILEAAEKLFGEHGFEAVSTAQIAQAAGVPKGLVFYYFPSPSKEAIYRAVLEERSFLPQLQTILETSQDDDPRFTLIKIGVRFIEAFRNNGNVVQLLLHQPHRAGPSQLYFEELRKLVQQRVAEYLEQARQSGKLGPVNPTALARLFLYGVLVAAVYEQPADAPSFVAEAVETMLREVKN